MEIDLVKQAVALNKEKIENKIEIAVIKAEHEMQEELIEMVSEALDNGSVAADNNKGLVVDKNI